MMSELMQASQFHEGNFHGQPSQGCRQWETGNNGISQFVLSTESEWGPCICPTKDEQRSTKLGKLPSSVVSYIGINKDDGQVYLLHDQILIQLAIKCHYVFLQRPFPDVKLAFEAEWEIN